MKPIRSSASKKDEELLQIQSEVLNLTNILTNLNNKINDLLKRIEDKRAAYDQAKSDLKLSDPDHEDHKRHLVFHGVELDAVRLELIKDPSYCQDILEARLRAVLFEQLNITRDIPLDKVGLKISLCKASNIVCKGIQSGYVRSGSFPKTDRCKLH